MQETRNKAILVKPIAGMSQFKEGLSLDDSEFRFLQGVYPKEAGIQVRMPGKVASNKFASSVLSIGDFLGKRIIQTSGDGLILEQDNGSFATLQNAAATQNKNRDSFAISPNQQLLVRANGEEVTSVIDTNGTMYPASIPQPTGMSVSTAAGGTLPYSRWYCYAFCYAAATAYPTIERTISINGQICPRGNPAISAASQTPSSGSNRSKALVCQALPVGRPDVDEIWIFRTTSYLTQAEAENAAAAGLMYYKAKITSGITYTDGDPIDGVDQIEMDNFGASAFKFVIFHHPYWIGFAADIFRAQVSWTSGPSGVITILDGTKLYPGRSGQLFKLTGVTTGGIDGKGTFRLAYLSISTATIDTFSLPVMSAGTKYITITPSTTTVYRSKATDPFAWGWTRVIGSSNEALEWAMKVGGGIGTAIATVPNESILKIDTEFPTRSFAYNLQVIDDFDQFRQTQKTISETFSVSSHGSQFAAQTQDGNSVLWGMDYKSFAILQSNGVTQSLVSTPVQRVLRQLTTTKADQLMCHGIYDPYTQCNCIWVTLSNAPSRVHYLVYQHAPTGFWGIVEDLDILCSANIQDVTTGSQKIMVGTESGLYGQAFVPGQFKNWTPTGNVMSGFVSSTTSTTIVGPAASFTVATGLVGSWVLLTDINDQNEEWARISAATTTQLTFDRTYYNGTRFATLQTVPFKWYLGLIECRAFKYFDFKAPNTDKQVTEMWLCQEGAVTVNPTIVRFYREWLTTLWGQIRPVRDFYKDTTPSTSFIDKKNIPHELVKSIGLELINREHTEWVLRNMVIKYNLVP